MRYENEHHDRPLFGVPWCIGVLVLTIATMIAAAFHIRNGSIPFGWRSINEPGGVHAWLPVASGLLSIAVSVLSGCYLFRPALRPRGTGTLWLAVAIVRWLLLAYGFFFLTIGVGSQWLLTSRDDLSFAAFPIVNLFFAGWLAICVFMGVLTVAAVAFHATKAIRARPA